VAELFPASRHVFDLNLHLHSDKQVFDFAGNHDYTIVTKDKDFYHLVNTFGAPSKYLHFG
jgi:predicted nuclease of predicted toxin-antitoxin system